MKDDEIFELAESNGFQDDFGRWNFTDDNLLDFVHELRQALAQPVDAVPGFTVTEPRQSLSRMKPGDRFVLVRTGEIYHIKEDGSQWNDTRQRLARLHKNSQVRLIVTHPKCDDACMNTCTEGFAKPPICNTPVDAVNISQERVDETAKREHEPVARVDYNRNGNIAWLYGPVEPDGTLLYTAPLKREWVGLTEVDIHELMNFDNYEDQFDFAYAIEATLKDKNT